MAELVWKEGVLIKHFPPESYTIKNIDDAFAFLKTDDGQKRFESCCLDDALKMSNVLNMELMFTEDCS